MEVNLHLASTEIKQGCENQALNFRLSSNEHLMAEVFLMEEKLRVFLAYRVPARAVKVWGKVQHKHFPPR